MLPLFLLNNIHIIPSLLCMFCYHPKDNLKVSNSLSNTSRLRSGGQLSTKAGGSEVLNEAREY